MRGRRLAPLPRRFFARPVVTVARDLLGHLLVHDAPEGRTVGRIVETEAYRGRDDPASHAYRMTPRSRIMAGPPAVAYVYFTYGNHFCVNVVAEREGVAGAVLLRAIEPLEGIELMARRRGVQGASGVLDTRLLASGPGRLTQAMGIDRGHNGRDLTAPPLFIAHGRPGLFMIKAGPRVGIRQGTERPWRFVIQGDPHVSRATSSRARDRPPGRAEAVERGRMPSRRKEGRPNGSRGHGTGSAGARGRTGRAGSSESSPPS
ncbi:MAG TPA: DNA-3-methyladenine glycosylase [bacterium]|nr:DNA-3-methyladenine glycosylase [bacterium]